MTKFTHEPFEKIIAKHLVHENLENFLYECYAQRFKEAFWVDGMMILTRRFIFGSGIPPFNHNLEYGELPLSYAGYTDPKQMQMKVKTMYVNGVHKEIHNWLEERGWYPKWYDAGTLFFWPNNTKGFGR